MRGLEVCKAEVIKGEWMVECQCMTTMGVDPVDEVLVGHTSVLQ